MLQRSSGSFVGELHLRHVLMRSEICSIKQDKCIFNAVYVSWRPSISEHAKPECVVTAVQVKQLPPIFSYSPGCSDRPGDWWGRRATASACLAGSMGRGGQVRRFLPGDASAHLLRSFITCIFTEYHCDEMKEGVMGGTHSKHEVEQKCTENLAGKPEGTRPLVSPKRIWG
jgi:hypothetical protein